jgi:hypothetical protein
MTVADHSPRIYQKLQSPERYESSNARWFDVAFTPEALQQRLQEQDNSFLRDAFGGLRCRTCSLPAIYHTLHLSVFINGRPIGKTTTRYLPICVMCHEFEGQVARLCLTTEDAISAGLVHPPSPPRTDNDPGTVNDAACGSLTKHEW